MGIVLPAITVGEMMQQNRQAVVGEIVVVIVVLIWAGNNSLVKWALSGVSPFVFNALRFFVATAFLGIMVGYQRDTRPLAPGDGKAVAILAVLTGVMYQVAYIIGVRLTTAGNSSVLLATAPLWTVLLNRVLHKEPIPGYRAAGMTISFSGVFMVIWGSGKKIEIGGDAIWGDLLSVAAAFLWALGSNLQKPLLQRYSAVRLNVYVVVTGTIAFILMSLPEIESPAHLFNGGQLAAAVISGLVSIGIASTLWSVGVKRLGPAAAANFGNLVPIAALFIAYVSLGEVLLPIQMAGAVTTIAGVWIARK